MGTRKKRRAVVDAAACVACGCCAKICPLSAIRVWRGIQAQVDPERCVGAISVDRGIAAKVDPQRCVGCGKCAKECPASIIEIQEVEA